CSISCVAGFAQIGEPFSKLEVVEALLARHWRAAGGGVAHGLQGVIPSQDGDLEFGERLATTFRGISFQPPAPEIGNSVGGTIRIMAFQIYCLKARDVHDKPFMYWIVQRADLRIRFPQSLP